MVAGAVGAEQKIAQYFLATALQRLLGHSLPLGINLGTAKEHVECWNDILGTGTGNQDDNATRSACARRHSRAGYRRC